MDDINVVEVIKLDGPMLFTKEQLGQEFHKRAQLARRAGETDRQHAMSRLRSRNQCHPSSSRRRLRRSKSPMRPRSMSTIRTRPVRGLKACLSNGFVTVEQLYTQLRANKDKLQLLDRAVAEMNRRGDPGGSHQPPSRPM